MDSMRAFLLIPAYNEASTIPFAVRQAQGIKRAGLIEDFIVVADGSTDGTPEIAEGMGANVLRLAENMGKGGAVLQGMLWCKQRGMNVLIMADADLISGLTPAQVSFVLGELGQSPLKKEVMMAVYPQHEQNGGSIAGAEATPPFYSGFRAIRMEGLNFLFSNHDGKWEFSNSKPARNFFDAASGWGLEAALNEVFVGRASYLPEDMGIFLTKQAFKGNERNREVQGMQIRSASITYISRRNAAELIKRKRAENRLNQQAR